MLNPPSQTPRSTPVVDVVVFTVSAVSGSDINRKSGFFSPQRKVVIGNSVAVVRIKKPDGFDYAAVYKQDIGIGEITGLGIFCRFQQGIAQPAGSMGKDIAAIGNGVPGSVKSRSSI